MKNIKGFSTKQPIFIPQRIAYEETTTSFIFVPEYSWKINTGGSAKHWIIKISMRSEKGKHQKTTNARISLLK